ncbi:MAG: efflux RND transporter permease subunit [Hydrogenobacter thermophilus]|uniref:efflux RND transporter permease subunit n=1 Tax=Hydrogenobacter thermophilus TaxID=940 RepID=UPI001C748803|nr:efflux RND transporter permease subunit [Hydrogenobacter thermophilus]QWK19444.1 MAG: efflux RND transporter permease subunit [Hydrogenobacter thermophilus]
MYKFFIHRPVTTIMFMLSFVLLGLYTYTKMPVDRLPNVDFPIVTVNTTYTGANPDVVDTNVTRYIEDEVSTISGIDAIVSQSYAGLSRVTIVFTLDKNIDVGAQEVRDAVQRAYRRMPVGVDPPVVRKVDTGSFPILAVHLHSKSVDYQTLAYYADKVIKRKFQKVNGVGDVGLGGFRDNVLWVRLYPERLYSYGITPVDVLNAVSKNHLEVPTGTIYGKDKEYIIRLYGKVKDPKELENTYLKGNLRLRDVGFVEFTEDEKRGIARFKGEQSVALIVYKQSGFNTVEVADAVKARMAELNRELPPGMRMDITFDASVFPKEGAHAAVEEIIIGSLLTALVVFVFLGSLRLTLIPVFAIPVTLLSAIIFLYYTGNSLNTFTLLALAVAVGIVIDDAIVVIESIYRRREMGLAPLEAAEVGTRIVVFALLASTTSLVIVFLPIIFLKGVIGSFFGSFALTLAVAIGVSYIVAISFTPMAGARLITQTQENVFMRAYEKFELFFDRVLRWSLDHKLVVLLFSIATVYIGFLFLKATKKEFFPLTDEGAFIVRFETPIGSSFEYTDQKAKEVEAVLSRNPYIDRFGIAIGQGVAGRPDVNGGQAFIFLKDRSVRPHQKVIMDQLRKELAKIKGITVSVEAFPIVAGAGRQTDITYAIRGTSLEELQKIANQMVAEFRQKPGYKDVDTDLRLNEPQIQIRVDREKLGDLGINVEDVGTTLNILFGKYKFGTYEVGGESYDAYIKAQPEFVKNWENLKKVYLRAKDGSLVPLTDVVSLTIAPGYHVINRYDRQYSFTFFANLSGKALGDATAEIESWLRSNLPPGYSFEPTGQTREFARAFKGLAFSLTVAIVGIYMVLASLFESYRHPFTVLLTVPLSLSGTFGLLYLTGTSLSVPSYFGIILLIGIVVRDAVLFIERIIQLRKEGYQTRQAILQARRERLRPILMTTLTVVFALLPVSLGLTAGSELRKPLAIAVIGGITTALPLSLLVLPIVYELFDSLKLKRR